MREIFVSPSATSAASRSAALARMSVAMTGAPDRRSTPFTMATLFCHAHVGPEPHQFRHVAEAVQVDGVGDGAGPVGNGAQRHDLRLHVGRESGERLGRRHERGGPHRSAHRDLALAGEHLAAGLLEHPQHDPRCAGSQFPIARLLPGDGGGREERGTLDAVGDDGGLDRPQVFHPADGQLPRADALDLGAALHQHLGERGDVGLDGHVVERGDALASTAAIINCAVAPTETMPKWKSAPLSRTSRPTT